MMRSTSPALALPDISLPDLSLPDLSLSDSLNSLATMASQLQAVINSAIAHPIWAIATILLTFTLVQIIADLIKRLVKAALTSVLKLPLTLSQWIWQRIWNRATTPSVPDKAERLQQLINRLDSLRLEQDQIMTELKRLLADTAKAPSSPEQPAEKPADRPAEKPAQLAATEERKSSETVSPEVG